MNKLFINLLFILGINFSVYGSERESIYEDEFQKAEGGNASINPLPFDRSSKPFEFVGSKEDLAIFWVVNGKRVSESEIKNNPDYAQLPPENPSAPTFCIINLRKKEKRKQLEQAANRLSRMIGHTKYNFNSNNSKINEITEEASAYDQRVRAYDALSEEERKKQIQEHLKREHDRSKTSTNMDPNSSGQ